MSDPIEQNENNMAAKTVEPKTNGEKELTMADLYNLILSSKDELKVDIKKGTEGIQTQIV